MSSKPLWAAHLNPNSPRYETWARILAGDEVPLVKPVASRANLGDEKNVEVYVLDIQRLTADQRDRLVQWVAEKFGVPPAAVNEQLESVGFPIREADVIVAFSMRAFL
jgi:hypothetical protein